MTLRVTSDMRTLAALFLLIICVPGCRIEPLQPGPRYSPSLSVDREGEVWIRTTLRGMTLEQKVGQLFSVVAPGDYESTDDPAYLAVREAIQNLQAGSITFLRSSPFEQAALTNDLQALSQVPLLVAQDMEFGAGMRVEGATRLPAPMMIGATRDLDLAYRAGVATASEARALGVHLVYAPVVDVNSDPANPIIGTRAFSDSPRLTGEMARAFVRGAQDGGVLATLKHFPGHGATSRDSHTSLPVITRPLAAVDSIDLAPFRAALDAQAAAVMVGHLSVPALDSVAGRPATLSPNIVQTLLRSVMGFNGLVVTDALNMAGVADQAPPGTVALQALQAGNDLLLMSPDPFAARKALLDAVEDGRLSEARINASVARILRVKAAVGLHEQQKVDLDDVRRRVGTARNRVLGETIARRGITLLQGSGPPLSGHPRERVLLVVLGGSAAESKSAPLREELRALLPDRALDVIGVSAPPGGSERRDLATRAGRYDHVVIATFLRTPGGGAAADAWRLAVDALTRTRAVSTTVVLGSPYLLHEWTPDSDVLLAAFDDIASVQRAVAAALTGRASLSGRSPVALSERLPFGAGSDAFAELPRIARAEEAGMEGGALIRMDSLLRAAIENRAFPGAAVAVGRGDALVRLRGYGTFAYDNPRAVDARSAFDLASLTKVIATTTAVMQLLEQDRIRLDEPVATYLPEFGRNGKDSVSVHHLLSHTGGLTPFRAFYSQGMESRREVLEAIYDEELIYEPGTESRYSDFGPIVLAEVVSRVTGQSFSGYVRRNITEPLRMWRTGFRGTGTTDPNAVPTELDTYFRNRLLQGEVHDENAWIMGGTAGHAGLFSTAEDLANFGFMLVNGGRVGDRQFLKPETIRLFTTPVDSAATHTRALGWDTKSPEGYSSAGQFFGPGSFGHTGFTGTSFWVDPDAQLFVVLLSNRVHPSRNNRGHIAVRPALADLVHNTIRRGDPVPMLPVIGE